MAYQPITYKSVALSNYKGVIDGTSNAIKGFQESTKGITDELSRMAVEQDKDLAADLKSQLLGKSVEETQALLADESFLNQFNAGDRSVNQGILGGALEASQTRADTQQAYDDQQLSFNNRGAKAQYEGFVASGEYQKAQDLLDSTNFLNEGVLQGNVTKGFQTDTISQFKNSLRNIEGINQIGGKDLIIQFGQDNIAGLEYLTDAQRGELQEFTQNFGEQTRLRNIAERDFQDQESISSILNQVGNVSLRLEARNQTKYDDSLAADLDGLDNIERKEDGSYGIIGGSGVLTNTARLTAEKNITDAERKAHEQRIDATSDVNILEEIEGTDEYRLLQPKAQQQLRANAIQKIAQDFDMSETSKVDYTRDLTNFKDDQSVRLNSARATHQLLLDRTKEARVRNEEDQNIAIEDVYARALELAPDSSFWNMWGDSNGIGGDTLISFIGKLAGEGIKPSAILAGLTASAQQEGTQAWWSDREVAEKTLRSISTYLASNKDDEITTASVNASQTSLFILETEENKKGKAEEKRLRKKYGGDTTKRFDFEVNNLDDTANADDALTRSRIADQAETPPETLDINKPVADMNDDEKISLLSRTKDDFVASASVKEISKLLRSNARTGSSGALRGIVVNNLKKAGITNASAKQITKRISALSAALRKREKELQNENTQNRNDLLGSNANILGDA